jgi:hypothetical protein
MIVTNMVKSKAAASFVRKACLCNQFVEQKLMLRTSFRCDQINKYDFGHLFLLLKSDFVQQTHI